MTPRSFASLAAVGLVGYEDLPLSQLSAGQQRRVALTRLWLTDAPLWILDEPFTALDATAMETLTRRLEQLHLLLVHVDDDFRRRGICQAHARQCGNQNARPNKGAQRNPAH